MAGLLKLGVALLLLVAGVPALDSAAGVPPPLAARLGAAFSAIGTAGAGQADGSGQQGGGGGGWMMECWSAVTELRSCTDEIVLFFLNDESYLGQGCCLAIRTVTHHCWPAMLASVGFTVQEADILRGFCDAEVGPGAHAPPTGGRPPAVVSPSPSAPAPLMA